MTLKDIDWQSMTKREIAEELLWEFRTRTWTLRRWFKHPVDEFRMLMHERSRPGVGGYVLYHGEQPPRKVMAVEGDDLLLEGTGWASWSACCEPVPKNN